MAAKQKPRPDDNGELDAVEQIVEAVVSRVENRDRVAWRISLLLWLLTGSVAGGGALGVREANIAANELNKGLIEQGKLLAQHAILIDRLATGVEDAVDLVRATSSDLNRHTHEQGHQAGGAKLEALTQRVDRLERKVDAITDTQGKPK